MRCLRQTFFTGTPVFGLAQHADDRFFRESLALQVVSPWSLKPGDSRFKRPEKPSASNRRGDQAMSGTTQQRALVEHDCCRAV
jgi:hypothetical protein